MLQLRSHNGRDTSLLDDYVNRYSDAVVRRRANVALRAARIESEIAYKTRGEILANMNHELRTPLNAIVGFTNMLKDSEQYELTPEQTGEYLDYILQSAELLLTHINTILDLASAQSGGAKMRRQPVSAKDLFDHCIEEFRTMAEQAGVELDLSVEPGLPHIEVDASRIGTAVTHLIENAVTYCEEGCTVSVLVRKGRRTGGRDWVYVAIKDNGAGMTSEELSRALKSFEQVHQGLHRKFEGSGIGLPVAKSFIELNGGKFYVKSNRGTGTTVRFALPAVGEVVATPFHQDLQDFVPPMKAVG